MEIKDVYNKVKNFLIDEIGNMTLPGDPKFDPLFKQWRVPVLCKTEKGVFIIGEISLNKNLDFIRIPSKEQMLKTLEAEMKQLPFLVYAEPEELKKAGLKAVLL